MTPIPYRQFYPIDETAQLTGMSEDFIRAGIRKAQRQSPPPDAIPFRRFGTQVRVPRSWIYPDEPGNVTPLTPLINDRLVDAIADGVSNRLFDRMLGRSA